MTKKSKKNYKNIFEANGAKLILINILTVDSISSNASSDTKKCNMLSWKLKIIEQIDSIQLNILFQNKYQIISGQRKTITTYLTG